MAATLISQATVISLDPAIGTLPRADVLIEDDRIVAVAPQLEVEAAQRVDGRGAILTPGFVDSHRHLWQTSLRGLCTNMSTMEYMWGVRLHLANYVSAQDMYIATFVGALEALNAGVTTVAGYEHNVSSPADARAGISALADAGIRSVYGMGLLIPRGRPGELTGLADQRRLLEALGEEFCGADRLISLAVCPGEFMVSGTEGALAQYRLGRDLGVGITHHAAVVAGSGDEISTLDAHGLLGPDVLLVHANGAEDHHLELMARAGASISVQTEVEMGMVIGAPSLVRLRAAGLAPTLGIDTVATNSGDMFAQMRLAFNVVCLAESQPLIDQGLNPLRLTVDASDALAWGTINGARALGLDAEIGSISPGKQADLVLLRADGLTMAGWYEADPAACVISQASPGVVDSVWVAGRCVKRAGAMLLDTAEPLRRLNDSKAQILARTPATPGVSGFRSVIPDPPPELPLVALAEADSSSSPSGRR
jgi:5-methylthioadenosine/S-adenosylhomocysteine deaminase